MCFSPEAGQAESGQMTGLSHQELLGKQSRGTPSKEACLCFTAVPGQAALEYDWVLSRLAEDPRRRRKLARRPLRQPPDLRVQGAPLIPFAGQENGNGNALH